MSYGSVDGLESLAQLAHIEDSLKIQQLKRVVNDNDTGECRDCGDDINPERLKAMPNAKYCVRCQGEHEKSGPLRLTHSNPYVP